MEKEDKLNNNFIQNLIDNAKEVEMGEEDIEKIISHIVSCGEKGENIKIKHGEIWLYSIFAEDENYRLATGFDKYTYLKIKKYEENKWLNTMVSFYRVWERMYKKQIKDNYEPEAFAEIEQYIESVLAFRDEKQTHKMSIEMMHLARLMRFAPKGNLVETAEIFKDIAATPEKRLFHPVTYFIVTSNIRENFIRAFMEDVYEIYGNKDRDFVNKVVDEYAMATKERLFGAKAQTSGQMTEGNNAPQKG